MARATAVLSTDRSATLDMNSTTVEGRVQYQAKLGGQADGSPRQARLRSMSLGGHTLRAVRDYPNNVRSIINHDRSRAAPAR